MNTKSNEPKQGWRNRFEIVMLGATAILSALVALLDFLGFLDRTDWLTARIPTLTLLSVGLVAGYLVLERRNQLENMQKDSQQRLAELSQAITQSTTTIIESLNGIEFKRFESANDVIGYVSKRLLQAKRQVDDLSWNSTIGLSHGLSTTYETDAEYAGRVAKVAERIPYREVFIFNRPGRIEKLKTRIEENRPGYSCAYYADTSIPLLQFMVIDNEEVIVLTDMLKSKFAVKHPYIVGLFAEYYEEIWRKATPIKIGTTIRQDVVERLFSS